MNSLQQQDNKEQLIREIHNVLNQFYPENNAVFMGLIFSRNRIVAEKLAGALLMAKEKDRKHIESQLMALLLAFQTGE